MNDNRRVPTDSAASPIAFLMAVDGLARALERSWCAMNEADPLTSVEIRILISARWALDQQPDRPQIGCDSAVGSELLDAMEHKGLLRRQQIGAARGLSLTDRGLAITSALLSQMSSVLGGGGSRSALQPVRTMDGPPPQAPLLTA